MKNPFDEFAPARFFNHALPEPYLKMEKPQYPAELYCIFRRLPRPRFPAAGTI